ncbi:MAG: putative polysaccharide biosynthesis protein [Marmoricola sp.]|nr:putative polysaccharide biosynthesis protein [Marmoricola sp.]
MKILSVLARDSAIYGGADFLSKLVAFLTFPLIAAALSPTGFGTLELVITMTSLLGMLANCGMNNAVQRFYWDTETALEDRPTLVSTGLGVLFCSQLAAALVGGLAGFVILHLYPQWAQSLGWLGIIAALVAMLANQVLQYLLDVTRLHQDPWRFMGVSIASRVATALAGLVAVVVLGLGLDAMLLSQALVAVAVLPLAAWAVSRDLRIVFDRSLAAKITSFGCPFIYASLAFWLFGSIDRWMLAAMASVEEVGIYSVAYRYASIVMFVSVAFGQAWSPFAIKLRADHPSTYRSLYTDVLLVLSCFMLALGGFVSLFADDLMALLMPASYASAAQPLAVLCLGVVLQSTMQVTAIGISLEKRTHLFARLSWMAAGLNFALNLLMIPPWGALGAAWATALSYLFLTGSYLHYTQRLHPLPLPGRRVGVWILLWLALAVFTGHAAIMPAWAPSIGTKLFLLLVCLAGCVVLTPWRNLTHVK